MKLTLEIIRMTQEKKQFFRVTDNLHEENAGIIGIGWTINDAIDDFIHQLQKNSFYDEETPILINRNDLELKGRITERLLGGSL